MTKFFPKIIDLLDGLKLGSRDFKTGVTLTRTDVRDMLNRGDLMIIMGVDPGYATLGYGIVNKQGNSFKPLTYGVITTKPDLTAAERLKIIYDGLIELIDDYQPEVMAVEELFFNRNVNTAIMVGQARGVILLSGANAGIPVFEYTPLQVKQGVVGYGRARKDQVRQMVKALLNLSKLPAKADAADALAVAICHGHSAKMIDKLGGY